MVFFDWLIEALEKRYYCELAMAVCQIIAIITGLLYSRKDIIGRFFISFLIIDFTLLLWGYYVDYSYDKPFNIKYAAFVNSLIAVVELIVYYKFFSKIILNKVITTLLKKIQATFIVIVAIFIISKFKFLTPRFWYISYILGTLEFLLLIPPCLVYYYELFKNDLSINLYQRPSFWIVTGVFVYSTISIPFYLLNRSFFTPQYQLRHLMAVLFYNLPLTINYIFLTRAFLCKKTLTI